MSRFMKIDAHLQGHALYKRQVTELTTIWINVYEIDDVHDGELGFQKQVETENGPEIRTIPTPGAFIAGHHGHMGSGGGGGPDAAMVSFFVPGVTAANIVAKIERLIKEDMDYARTGPMPEPKKEA